ncbi:MAG: hypothetical protein AAB356_08150 [Deltaproteobacteria bacterium]
MAYNWRVIRSGYESAGLSFHELAEKYGPCADALERRAKKEGWRATAEGRGSAKKKTPSKKMSGAAIDGNKAIVNGIKKRLIKGLKSVDSKKGLEELKVAKAAGEVMEGLRKNERDIDGNKRCSCSEDGQDVKDIVREMESLTVSQGTDPALEGE